MSDQEDRVQDIPPTTEGPGSPPGDPGGDEHPIDADAGGRAHTPEGRHPAGDGPRSARDVGGPTAAPDAPPTTGGAKGDIKTRGFEEDSHT